MGELNQLIAQHLLASVKQLSIVFARLAALLVFLQFIYDKNHLNSGGSTPNG